MADYQAGEHLRFQLFDQDLPFVKEDDYLGSVVLESNRFCPQASRLECQRCRPFNAVVSHVQGFEGELRLTGGGKGHLDYLHRHLNGLGVEAYLEVKVGIGTAVLRDLR